MTDETVPVRLRVNRPLVVASWKRSAISAETAWPVVGWNCTLMDSVCSGVSTGRGEGACREKSVDPIN